MDVFDKLKELGYELTDEHIEDVKGTLPKTEDKVDLSKYMLIDEVKSGYVSKDTMNDVVQKRLAKAVAKKNEIEEKYENTTAEMTALQEKYKKYKDVDIEALQSRVSKFETQVVSKAKKRLKTISELDDKIKSKFKIPEKDDEKNYKWAEKLNTKYEEYASLGLFDAEEDKKSPNDKKPGSNKKTKYTSPFEGIGGKTKK